MSSWEVVQIEWVGDDSGDHDPVVGIIAVVSSREKADRIAAQLRAAHDGCFCVREEADHG